MLAACVTAIASWPLYTRFAARLPRRIGRNASSLIFTLAMMIFVLAPLMFAFGALLTEAHALLLEIAAADKKGIAVPQLLENAPLVGPWLAARWQSQARLSRRPSDLDAADRPGCAPWLGAIARTVHGPTRVRHRIHDPVAVFPVSGG
jgi:predicted PurR-regulated permease PerM